MLLPPLLLLSPIACTSNSLTSARAPDAGSEALLPDAGSQPDGPGQPDTGMVDTAPLLPAQFAMTSTITTVDGGYVGGSPPPGSHVFSMLVDWGAGTITSGSNGTATQVGLRRTGDSDWEAIDPIAFNLGSATFPTISYANLKLTRGDDGCTASATGAYQQLSGDVVYNVGIRASMAGVRDRTAPVLTAFPAGPVHPLSFTGVMVDELLPGNTTATLVSSTASVPLTPAPTDTSLGVSAFGLRSMALAFGNTYGLKIQPSAVDLAGNQAVTIPSVSTLSDPGVLTQDGFEGTINAYMVGFAPITSADTLPIPAGTKAIAAPGGFTGVCNARFTSRLSVKAGATSVKLSFITYQAKSGWAAGWSYSHYFTVAVPNGSAVSTMIGNLKTTPLSKPWTGDAPGSDVNSYGDLLEAQLPLPPDTDGEVMLDILAICAQPGPPPPGIIIDDVRVE
jgi:hypothetical protein